MTILVVLFLLNKIIGVVTLLPERQVSLRDFLERLRELQVTPHLRFAKDKPWSSDNHDRIFLVCTQEPLVGAHIGRTCTCCEDTTYINPYSHFKDAMSREQYDAIAELLFDFTYSDEEHKTS